MTGFPRFPRLLSALSALLALLSAASGMTLTDALNAPALSWQSTPGWSATLTSQALDGVDAAQATAGARQPEQRLTTFLPGPGLFSVWWRCLAGDEDGSIVFEVDDRTVLKRNSQPFTWEKVSVNVPAGSHTVSIIIRGDNSDVTAIVDQASYNESRLPAALALGDAEGLWVQTGDWQQSTGATHGGTGDFAAFQYPGGAGSFRLVRLMSEPATVKYWRKIDSATPGLYTDTLGRPFPPAWTQFTVIDGGRVDQPGLLDLSVLAGAGAAQALVSLDDLEITALSLQEAVDLPQTFTVFTVSAGSNPWRTITEEADVRRTGSAEVVPGKSFASADLRAVFSGPGLLTWSWRKSVTLEDTLNVTVNNTSPVILDSDADSSRGFAHASRVLTTAGTNSVLWHFQWGANGANPMAIDDVLFCPSAGAGLREAIEISAATPLYAAGAWAAQTLITHDGVDALELPVAGNGSRAALTMPVVGPGILSWWWRADLPEDASFQLHREGRAVQSLKATSGWQKASVVLRDNQDLLRWEVLPGAIAAGPSHRVWLDEISFEPQSVSVASALDDPARVWSTSGDVFAANVPAPESHDGTDALVLTGALNNSLVQPGVHASFPDSGTLSFWVKFKAGPSYYGSRPELIIDGNHEPLDLTPGPGGWKKYAFHLSPGPHTAQWNGSPGSVLTLDEVVFTPEASLPLNDALDGGGLIWEATAAWKGTASSFSRDGVDSAEATSTDDDEMGSNNQTLSTTVTGPGMLSLWWRVLTNDDEGTIEFTVDGLAVVIRSSERFPWEQISVNVPPGSHTFGVVLHADGAHLTGAVDEVTWSPGARLPAAVAMGDPDGFWVQKKEWQRTEGASRDGTGDAATLFYPGGDDNTHLVRITDGPAVVRYWQKVETTTPSFYTGAEYLPVPASWTQTTLVAGGKPGETCVVDLPFISQPGAATATLLVDDVQVTPLTFASAIDLSPQAPAFTVSPGSAPWRILKDEADLRHTGCVEVSPGLSNATAGMHAAFNGPGLLTWSWRKWSPYDESLAVTVNGTLTSMLTTDFDLSAGFAHNATVLTGTGANDVLWLAQWGTNGFNPIAFDDFLFSPPAPAGVREAIGINAGTPLYAAGGNLWTPQTAVTHDGASALELQAAAATARTALSLPLTGPGILSWWWRSDLPAGSSFRLHQHGHEARTLSGVSGWRQEFLAVRNADEVFRWEVYSGGTPAGSGHRVWLDEVTFTPQSLTTSEAVDLPGSTWTRYGDVLPAALPAPGSHDGTDALVMTGRPGFLPWAESTFTGPGTLTFWMKVRPGPAYYGTPLLFLMDGGNALGGELPNEEWKATKITIPAGNHTLRWSANPGSVLTLDEVTFIPAGSYAAWALTQFPGGQPSGPADDPDNDGISNLLEFAFNSQPLNPGSAGRPFIRTLESGGKVIEFVRDLRANVIWQVEASSDLISWQGLRDNAVSTAGFLETRQAELPEGLTFARVKVSLPP